MFTATLLGAPVDVHDNSGTERGDEENREPDSAAMKEMDGMNPYGERADCESEQEPSCDADGSSASSLRMKDVRNRDPTEIHEKLADEREDYFEDRFDHGGARPSAIAGGCADDRKG